MRHCYHPHTAIMGNTNGKPVVFTDEGQWRDWMICFLCLQLVPNTPVTDLRKNRRVSIVLLMGCFSAHWAVVPGELDRPRNIDGLCFWFQKVPHCWFVNVETVNLNHFRLLRVVGKGAFGKVRIVERRDTGLTFALKYIRKDEGM